MACRTLRYSCGVHIIGRVLAIALLCVCLRWKTTFQSTNVRLQIVTEFSDELQLQVLSPHLESLFVSAIVAPFLDQGTCTSLTALRLDSLEAAAVQPALALLQRLPSLHSFALTCTRDVAQHLGGLAAGSRLRSLAIVHCELQQLPESMGIWAAKLTRLDLSRNHLSHFPLLVRDMLQLKVLDLNF